MESIAIWYKQKDNSDISTNLELHLNLWKLPKKGVLSKFSRFLDFGLKFEKLEHIEEVLIFFPIKIETKNIVELGGKIVENKNLLNTIFNEDYSIKSSDNNNYHDIYDSEDKNVFSIYVLDDKFKIEQKYGGTLITIKLPSKKKDNTYIRFRISGDFLARFSSIERPANSFFQSAFSKIEIIDLRINEARALDNKLLEDISSDKNKKFKIKKLHFFFICGSEEDYIFAHQPFISCRKLEQITWENYINNNNNGSLKNGSTILAYHWKEKKDGDKQISDYNALIKTKFRKNDFVSIIAYLVGLFIISLLISIGISSVRSSVNVNKHNNYTLDSVTIKRIDVNYLKIDTVNNCNDTIFYNPK